MNAPPTRFTSTTFPGRLREAREAKGYALDDAVIRVRMLLGPDLNYGLKKETLRRIEVGATKNPDLDPLLVVALADVYGVRVDDLSEEYADKALAATRLGLRHFGERVRE